MRTLGSIVQERREQLGLTLRGLAELVRNPLKDGHIAPQYLQDIERDRRSPSPAILRGIAAAIGLDADFLAASAGQVPDAVSNYLRTHPEECPAIRALFERALKFGFTNWDGVVLHYTAPAEAPRSMKVAR